LAKLFIFSFIIPTEMEEEDLEKQLSDDSESEKEQK
jgi:hypothetical protein